MAELTFATYEQIETILTKVANNYSELARVFYNVFYNVTPMDVTFQMFDEAGVLQTYTIPNRAKDFTYILNGEGSPEGNVEASKGSTYQDLTNGNLYIKQTDGGNEGWSEFLVQEELDSYLLKGEGIPEGEISAEKGTLYIDIISSSLYIKTTSTGTQGWLLISANTEDLANRDLNNLTEIGENKFANPSLSNLSIQGQNIIDSKEDVLNKVDTLSAASTNEQYPTAKVTFDYVNSKTSSLANKDLNNLTETGSTRFLGYSQIRDCVLEAITPINNTENQVTLPSGTILLLSNGLTAKNTLNNEKVVLTQSYSINIGVIGVEGIIFFDNKNKKLIWCEKSNYYEDTQEPSIVGINDVWYNSAYNTYHCVRGGNWDMIPAVRVAYFETDGSGILTLDAIKPVELVMKTDFDNLVKRLEALEALIQHSP